MTTLETSPPEPATAALGAAGGATPGRVGLAFAVQDARSAVDLVQRAEEAGVGTAWMIMHPAGYDSPTLAAAALAVTTRIRVGTSIVPVLTRHPVALATQVVALAELAPARFRLGIGTSSVTLLEEGFGTPVPHPVAAMREYIDVLRAALDTGVVDHQGATYRVNLQLVTLPAARSAPMGLSLAALGPRMFELAGQRADAAISWTCPPAYIEAVARPAVARGAAAAGRPAPPILTQVSAVVTGDAARARDAVRPTLAAFGRNPHYARMFAGAGLPVAADGTPSDELVDSVTAFGDEAALTDRLGTLAEAHDELVVTLESSGGAERRAEEDTLLRALANVTAAVG